MISPLPARKADGLEDFAKYSSRFRDLVPEYKSRAVDNAREMALQGQVPEDLYSASDKIAAEVFKQFSDLVTRGSRPDEENLKKPFLKAMQIREFGSSALETEIIKALKPANKEASPLNIAPLGTNRINDETIQR